VKTFEHILAYSEGLTIFEIRNLAARLDNHPPFLVLPCTPAVRTHFPTDQNHNLTPPSGLQLYMAAGAIA
jgi:hypothetical protein